MKKFVVVPTYNESQNISRLLREIFATGLTDLSVVVVDDHSPDGTSQIVSALCSEFPGLYLVERVDDKGRGTAGIVGFDVALQLGAEAIVEMDADFSHPPSDLPRLFDSLAAADIVIASRMLRTSRDHRPKSRRIVTKLANAYCKLCLERPGHLTRVSDWTTGFRAYRREVFTRIPTHSLISRGPSILQEILYRALNLGLRAMEIPFQMVDRAEGKSSFSSKIALQSLLCVPAYPMFFGGKKPLEFSLLNCVAEKTSDRHFTIRRSTALPRGGILLP